MKRKVKVLNTKYVDDNKNTNIVKNNIEEVIVNGKKKVKLENTLNKKPTEIYSKMKRKAKNLSAEYDGDSKNAVIKDNIEEGMDGGKKKKVKFEKSLNKKPIDESMKKKPLPVKKDSKKKNSKAAQHKTTIEKTDWLKLKKEKKELKKIRKAKKKNDDKLYNLIVQAKQTYEKLRRFNCTQQDSIKLTQTLHNRLEGFYSKIIFTHDMSRVIQCMIKHCEVDVRQAIFRELKPFIVEISQSKYAKNCVETFLKYGSQEIKNEVVSAFYGNVVKLMSHIVSAPIVELVYSSYCEDYDKIYFKQEFYGDMYKQAKDKAVKTLLDVFETAEDMKSATLSAVKANLIRILNKDLIHSTLLHTILWEFFCACSTEDRTELIVMLRDSIVALTQTKMGAKVAVQCIWHGNNKDRKIILKAFKENVKSVCMSEYGYMTLLALFDAMDDTVIVKKIILVELQKDLVDIALNEYGKHVILYLVARRNSHYFPPNVVEYLRQGDNNSASKKSADVREKELLEAIRNPLLEAVTADAATWLSNSAIAMVTLAILKIGSGEKLKAAFESIAKFISRVDSKIQQDDVECSAVEHSGLHMMLKKLIQNDKELLSRAVFTFGEILISQLDVEVLEKWIEFNRACFLLVFLAENESEEVVSTLFTKLEPLEKKLQSKKNPGALILLKKMKKTT